MAAIHRFSDAQEWGGTRYVDREKSWCPSCLSPSSQGNKIKFDLDSVSIVECEKCGVLHLNPLPTAEYLHHIYNSNYYNDSEQAQGYYDYEGDEQNLRKTYAKRFRKIIKALGISDTKNLSLHEIGCATGIGLDEMGKISGSKISGSDISKDAQEACAKKGLQFFRSDEQARHSLDSGKKDLVIIYDVVEHLRDFATFQEFLAKLVEPGGYVAITTPNFDSFFNKLLGKRSPSIKIPQHTIYFNSTTLAAAMAGRFQLKHEFSDSQYTSLTRLFERVSLAINIDLHLKGPSNWNVLVPNGMSLYIFQRT